MESSQVSIFTHMFSLLHPYPTDAAWPVSLELPCLFVSKVLTEKKKGHKKISDCPHTYRKYYAKSMCRNCYQKVGRKTKAWNCEHLRETSFAGGKCQSCYMKSYYQAKKSKLFKTACKSSLSS
mmetsp:Transcript_12801/g.23844  ORF Transcript_12801/g.23844 Transcript_12801/m.23844 type:complete len:123 (+) Transcript_12801:398-766(+)